MQSPRAQSAASRHSRAGGNPGLFSDELAWIPAFAGMTESNPAALRLASHTYFRRRILDFPIVDFGLAEAGERIEFSILD
jgi:hypothetical protein